MAPSTVHPLCPLSETEFKKARDTVVQCQGSDASLFFRSIYLYEPKKVELVPYLVAEHAGKVSDATPKPTRRAHVHYDVIQAGKLHVFTKSVVDLDSEKEVSRDVVGPQYQTGFTALVSPPGLLRATAGDLHATGPSSKPSRMRVLHPPCSKMRSPSSHSPRILS